MRNIKILNVIMFLILLVGCSQANFFVGGGQSLDLEAPKLTLITPTNFSFVPANFIVDGIVTDNVGVKKVVVILYKNEDETVVNCNASISGGTFKAEIKNIESGEYSLVVNAYDEAGNTSITSSKSISITVDAGSSSLILRKPSLFWGLSEETLNSKKDFNYVDIDYFKNETFEISGTIEEDYGVGALTLQLEFVGSKVNDGLFDDSEDNSIAYEYRIFRKYGEYYYNNGKEDILAEDIFSGSLNNFTFNVDTDKLNADGKPLEYDRKYFFKVHIVAEKKTVPVESFDFYPGYLCVYPKSNEPWVVPSFVDGTSFSAGSSIFGEAYDDDGISQSSVFYCIVPKDKGEPELSDFSVIDSEKAESKKALTWQLALSADILPGNYKIWYYAKDINGVFPKRNEDSSKPLFSSMEFLVPDPGQPISKVSMYKGTDLSNEVSEYPADKNGMFLLAGEAYDTVEVQDVIFAWVPKDCNVPNWNGVDWSTYIGKDWSENGDFYNGVKYWRIPLGDFKNTPDGRKSYDISLQLNDYTDFLLEDGETAEYDNKHFYIFTKGADDAEGNVKSTIVNFTVPRDLMPPKTEKLSIKDNDNNDVSDRVSGLPITFTIKAFDNESQVKTVNITANGFVDTKKAVLDKDGNWSVIVDSSDFVAGDIDETKKFIITTEDFYGNKSQTIKNIPIKNQALKVSKITSDSFNITKSIGDIEIEVIVDGKILTIDGKPTLRLNVDNFFKKDSVYADYLEFKNFTSDESEEKTSIFFKYTICEGDNASPLNVAALELNGAIIKDINGNSVSGDIPVYGANSLKNRNIIIDTTAPQIQSIITSMPKGAYGMGRKIDIRVSFDRVLTLDDTGNATLVVNTVFGGKKVLFDSINSKVEGNTVIFDYVVSDGENTEKLDVLTFENGGMIADERGNKAVTTDCYGMLAGFREIIIDTTVPQVVSYGVNGVSGKDINEVTYNTNVNSKIEIEFNEEVMKNSGSILLERVYKSYPAVLTNEEKASYESIRSFSKWNTYYVNRCIGTVNNNGVEPDREAKWVLKYEYEHGAYENATENGACKDLWNYFADVNVTDNNKCVDYNCIRIDVKSGLVKVDGKKVTITPPHDLPEGIMFYINVPQGVFLDRANNKNATSEACKFETVNAAAPVIRINKLSGLESGSQPTSTAFKISSETYNASYYYGFVNTKDSGNIPTGAPTVNKTYTGPVSIGNGDPNAYVYKIFAKTKNENNKNYSGETKELAFKTVIKGLSHGAFGSDSTGGPASTTEFPLAWGRYVTSSVPGKYMSQATNGYLYSWHILKDFQYKSAKSATEYASGDSNTTGLAGALCTCGESRKKEQYTISAICTVVAGEALYFALNGNSTAIKGLQSGTTWSTTISISGSISSFYVYKGPATLRDSVSINNTSLVRSTESFSISEMANPIFPQAKTLTATNKCAAGEALYFTGTFNGANNNAIAFKGTLTGTNTWTFDTYGFTGMTWKVLKGKDSLGDKVTIAGSSLLSMKGSVSYPITETVPVFPTPVTLTATYSSCKTGENIYFSGNFHGTETGTVALKGTQSGSTWTLTVTADTDTFSWYVLKGKNTSSTVANSSLLKMDETAKTAPKVVSIANPTFPEGRIAVTCTSGLSSTEAIYFAGTFDGGSTSTAVKGTKDSTGKWYLDVSYGKKGSSFTWSVYKGSNSGGSSISTSSLTPAQGTNSFTGVRTQSVTFPTDITLTINSKVDWDVWSSSAKIYAWVWGGSYSKSTWVECSKNTDGFIKLVIKAGGCEGFNLVRRKDEIPTASLTTWVDGYWNKTEDIKYLSGQKEYDVPNGNWNVN